MGSAALALDTAGVFNRSLFVAGLSASLGGTALVTGLSMFADNWYVGAIGGAALVVFGTGAVAESFRARPELRAVPVRADR